ncbi:MAG TPA: hypothetical protein VF390_00865 [Patescibacteria group bacterium]
MFALNTMKDFWKKYKLWVNIILYLAAMAAVFLLITKPLLLGIQEKSDEIEKVKIDNQISQERIAKLPEMGELHTVFAQEQKNLNVVMDQNNSVDFIKRLELLAQETGNKISLKIDDGSAAAKSANDSKAVSGKKDAESIISNLPAENYLSMEITLEGKYENFIQFLYKLENLNYYVNVISLSLAKETIDDSGSNSGLSPNQEKNIALKDILVSSLKIIVYIK